MSDIVFATTPADAQAAEKVVAHHAEMNGQLAALVAALAGAGSAEAALAARDALVQWGHTELLPHAEAEELVLYRAAGELSELRALLVAMIDEHGVLADLVGELADARQPGQALLAAGGLQAVLGTHVHKENEILLPALVGSSVHSVADLLSEMEHAFVEARPAGVDQQADGGESGCGGHSCACGEGDAEGYPVLDARAVPHAIRHATIFGALDAVAPDGGMVLVAPHDPLPLLDQIEARSPGRFEISYLQRGPEDWHLQFVRTVV